MKIELVNESIMQRLRFGKMKENYNLDLIVFSNPLYFLEIDGYEKAFHTFEIIYN